MVDKNLDALIEDVVHGALEDYVEKMSSRLMQYLLDGVDNPDMLSTLAARAKSDAMAIFIKYKGRISKETREAFLSAVEGYETEVEQTLEKLHTKRQLTKQGALEFAQAARGIGEIVNRQNIALANTMATTWYAIAANAVVRKELGDSRRSIMEDAVRALSDAGIETVDYKSGVKTTIDAAVRRHIVSQVSQAKAQILSDRCDQYDQDLVFVSAHFGARPSHAIWQGKVYSRSGTSDKYPSLDEGTGYSGTGPFAALGDRLCGVNCQHEMVPYMPGLSQLPDLSFEKEQKRYGMTSEEYYKATQKQRALERKVRKYKRRIALGQEQGLDMVDDRYKLGRAQALLREHCRANGLTRLYERERAYGVKRQPRSLKIVPVSQPKKTLNSDLYYSGTFPTANMAIKAYEKSDDLPALFSKRTEGASIIFEGTKISNKAKAEIAASFEQALTFIDKDYQKMTYLVRVKNLNQGVSAQIIRKDSKFALVEISPRTMTKDSREQRIQKLFHEIAHTSEWRYTTMKEWNKQSEYEIAFNRGERDTLPKSKAVTALEKAFKREGIKAKYDSEKGYLIFDNRGLSAVEDISDYMGEYTYLGADAVSELIAESIRYVAVHGEGSNIIADIVAGEVLEWF